MTLSNLNQKSNSNYTTPLILLIVLSLCMSGTLLIGKGIVDKVIDANTAAPSQAEIERVIITGLKDVTELDTSEMYTNTVVVTSQDNTLKTALGSIKLGSTKIIYEAVGKVRAGINVSQLQVKDVDMKNRRITIILPPPRILDKNIDVMRSNVIDVDKKWFAPDVGTDLQMLAQQKALDKLSNIACENGLLNKANDSAKNIISTILNKAGYKEVIVQTQPPEPSVCPATSTPGT
ncbi:MAG TPA: DUF4230 domain-containing protein [Candidatus Obscuribacterales bacterium]